MKTKPKEPSNVVSIPQKTPPKIATVKEHQNKISLNPQQRAALSMELLKKLVKNFHIEKYELNENNVILFGKNENDLRNCREELVNSFQSSQKYFFIWENKTTNTKGYFCGEINCSSSTTKLLQKFSYDIDFYIESVLNTVSNNCLKRGRDTLSYSVRKRSAAKEALEVSFEYLVRYQSHCIIIHSEERKGVPPPEFKCAPKIPNWEAGSSNVDIVYRLIQNNSPSRNFLFHFFYLRE